MQPPHFLLRQGEHVVTKRVAVFGASGRIGQAQIRQLLKHDHRPVAVTRHAAILDRPDFAGAQLAHGDFADRGSIRSILEQVDAAFVQLPSFAFPADKVAYASNLVDVGAEVKLGQLVFNTTMWSPDDGPCGEPHYDHGRLVEDIFLNSIVPVTIVRPVLFMDNLVSNLVKPSIVEDGIYRYVQRPGLLANIISLDDVGRYMIALLDRPDLIGRRITLGGPERLSVEEVVEIISEAVGKPLGFEYLPGKEFGEYFFRKNYPHFGTDPAPMMAFFDSFYTFNNYSPVKPFEVDIDALDALIPLKATTMREWAMQQDWSARPAKDEVGSPAG
jgi:uncharacterized protein YbjT (DUF2867 family)